MPKTDENPNPAAATTESEPAASPAADNATAKPTQNGATPKAKPGAAQAADAVSLLKQDHRKVDALFAEFEGADDERKRAIVREACQELIVHTLVEERLFYPAVEEVDEDEVNEARVEHDSAKMLILELLRERPGDEYRDAKFNVLAEQIKHHVKEEEAPEGLFAKAQKAGMNTRELAQRITTLKEQLQQQAQAGRLPDPVPASFHMFGEKSHQEDRMPSYRDRDDEGRFVSHDDRGRQSRGRDYDDDDNRGRSRSASNERDRDDRGRFIGEDNDRSYRSQSERGHGGWYGDREGHSQASRQRGDERDSGQRGRSDRDDDDRGYRSRQGGSQERGHGGWFGDPEGHSEASRRGWEEREGDSGRSHRGDDNRGSSGGRGQGGWFGDSEGHSEASRRGWEERGRGESRSYASRDRDDDRGRDGGRGHGGWSGDSEGHAEAARRGWENRR